MMSLEEIKAAVEAGKTVYVSNSSYRVVKDRHDQWLIVHRDGYAIGLTWLDGVTPNFTPEECFIPEQDNPLAHFPDY
jgi:hypothetical protein